MNLAVILAAGRSTRFSSEIPKQLIPLNGKPVIQHSIDIFSEIIDDILVVTNSNCSKFIKHKNILINDRENRLSTIEVALNHVQGCHYNNIIIHDAARPFISKEYIEALLVSSSRFSHSQYVLKINNGLAQIIDNKWIIPDREQFIQLCTPQITNFNLFKKLFKEYILTGLECEILPVVSKLNFDFNLIEGSEKYLRKLTTIDDL